MRYFNTEGVCRPHVHYVARLDSQLKAIREQYVDRGKYFLINRGIQSGKSTTLYALADYLKDYYLTILIDFRKITADEWNSVESFTERFMIMFKEAIDKSEFKKKELSYDIVCEKGALHSLRDMMILQSEICKAAKHRIVLMIDNADNVPNKQLFADFLSILRADYMNRYEQETFHSVIIACTKDIRNIGEEVPRKNSPWNIATILSIDMNFSKEQIATMLYEYERTKNIGIDIQVVSETIYEYTNGHPYFVSAICKILDEVIIVKEPLKNTWTRAGIVKAIEILLKKGSPIFERMTQQIRGNQHMRKYIDTILFQRGKIHFCWDIDAIKLGTELGLLKEDNDYVVIANRIFEMYLLDLFLKGCKE